ncbi:hypothetical protein DO97_09140 [Neosynechococcus sphagnicola sy1]|uniref:GmrSD restriction endonucleases N-terminal domain-containing protein n=1 Tax=Neosynechococcus sphagnicola sy1 TaxID=1497020 RepID=A0A098TNE9_9CYAN|nr:DUF262 domain-containing protein [Neosynechococcus sphagnicola]KGF72368.1 hypothetical protein DO97_09140 [Neosynechococcus sphagnicola sy1]
MALQDEIDLRSTEVKSDSYSMSIGELTNLYQDKEIDIHPEFQRFYRWSPLQKTKLIESILLGIPLPPIFVSQRKDGVWDVVDGLQRLSTIFQFMGILLNEEKKKVEPLTLEETKYLPSLINKKWDNPEDPENAFTAAQKLFIKRSKLDVKIILKESDEKSKYELFQRLNTGGSPLSDQELRNCILIMENRKMFSWLSELSKDEGFEQCIVLTDRAKEEQYDMDLALRFIVFRTLDAEEVKRAKDINEFVTDKMLEIARNPDFNFDQEAKAFKATFSILNETIGADCFHRYDVQKQRFLGGFLLSAFEAVALGIGYNYEAILDVKKSFDILERIKKLWGNKDFIRRIGSGKTASLRMPRIVPLGRDLFQP